MNKATEKKNKNKKGQSSTSNPDKSLSCFSDEWEESDHEKLAYLERSKV